MKIVLGTMIKNEGSSILEWIAYHLSQGIDAFYIADNDSTDSTSKILRLLSQIGIVKHIKYVENAGERPQLGAFSEILKLMKADHVDLAGFIDLDEFIVPDKNTESVNSYLTKIFQDEELSAVAMNWAVFGSSGYIFVEPGLVLERFKKRSRQNFPPNSHYKSIFRIARANHFVNPHHILMTSGKYCATDLTELKLKNAGAYGITKNVCWKQLKLNHYVIKSAQEFIETKLHRGNASTPKAIDKISYFRHYDRNDEDCDLALSKAKITWNMIDHLISMAPELMAYAPKRMAG